MSHTSKPAGRTDGPFIAYADGACKGNGAAGGKGGWGVQLRSDSGGVLAEHFGGQGGTTNNQMELTAVIEALRLIAEGQKITVYTDSQYVQKGLSEWIHGWKRRNWMKASGDPVLNADLWRTLDALRNARTVDIRWVRGHNGDPGNERADELANLGAEGLTSV